VPPTTLNKKSLVELEADVRELVQNQLILTPEESSTTIAHAVWRNGPCGVPS
jgi:hypothetical protein